MYIIDQKVISNATPAFFGAGGVPGLNCSGLFSMLGAGAGTCYAVFTIWFPPIICVVVAKDARRGAALYCAVGSTLGLKLGLKLGFWA